MDTTTVTAVIGAAAAVVGTGVIVGQVIGRPLRRLARQNDLFREEWWGKPAEPMLNRPRTPGVPERIARIESELRPNHGSSLRDALDRVETAQAEQARLLAAHLIDPNAHPRGHS